MAVIGTLGQLPFVCSDKKIWTFDSLSRTNNARWARHDVIGKKPVMEFVGEDLSTVSLTIKFIAPLTPPPKEGLDRLKRMLDNHLYKTLVIGGEILGRYVIESVEEERKYHDGKGVCLSATAKISLTEWGR